MATSPARKPKLKAAILGGSIAGLMAGLVLHEKDFDVVLYEREKEYTRSIQWTVRQSFIDYLSSVDQAMANDVYKLVSPITNGYRYLSDRTLKYPNGAYKHVAREKPRQGRGAAPRTSCETSLDIPAIGIIRARELEACLRGHLEKKSNVVIRPEDAPKCELSGKQYVLIEDPYKPEQKTQYDLIVVCVGAGGSRIKNFKMIDYLPLSRARAQVSGEVFLQRRGMVIQYQHAKKDKKRLKNLPSGELLFSALLSTDELDTTCWVIGDVSTEFAETFAKAESNENKQADLAKEECGNIAARTMLETQQGVLDAEIKGVLGGTVKSFVSQAKISSAACSEENLILAGDAVGAGHWAVGGGMHVAGMCHQKRLDSLATELLAGADRKTALEKYSKGALDDSMAWISKSMEYYYLSIPKDVVEAVFEDVLEDFYDDRTIDAPSEMRERIIELYFGPKTDKNTKKFFKDTP